MLFTKKLSIGNRALDSEHKELHGIISEITRAIAAGNADALPESFEQMESRLRTYFAVEENIAHAVGFDFTQHRLAHRDLWAKFQYIKNELTDKKNTLSEREKNLHIHCLNNYLIQHITVDCKPLKIVLDTHYYDFIPKSTAWPKCA